MLVAAFAGSASAANGFQVHDTNAATNVNPVTSGMPHFSWNNDTGATQGMERTQVATSTTANVAALWHLDSLYDDSGNGRSLSNGGTPVRVDGMPGFGQALSFNGSTNRSVVGPDVAALDFADNFTVEAWVRWDNVGGSDPDRAIVEKGGGTNRNYTLVVEADGTIGFIVTASGDKYINSGSLTVADHQWHHVAGVVRSGTMYLYVDGIEASQTLAIPAVTGGMLAGHSPRIGSYGNGAGGHFLGEIDEVRISNVARTQAEIAAYVATRRPHNETIWDSSIDDAGINLPSTCGNATRCPDVVYGATGTDPLPLQPGGQYFVRSKLKPVAGAWTSWSTWSSFNVAASAMTAPAELFTHDFSAQLGSANNAAIRTATPHMSWTHTGAAAANAQRVQVWGDPVGVGSAVDDTVAHWRLDTATGTTVDSSGNGHTLTHVGSPTSAQGPSDLFSQGMSYNASLNQRSTAASSTAFNLKRALTAELWFRTSSTAGQQHLLARAGDGGSAPATFMFWLDGPILKFEVSRLNGGSGSGRNSST